MNSKFKQFVRFIWKGVRYQYNVLAMGLAPAPRQFTKLMRPVLAHSNSLGISVSAYLADLFISAPSEEQCAANIQTTIEVLRNLGFAVNEKKSVVKPTQLITHLGFVMATKQMVVYLSPDKLEKLKVRAKPLI